MVGIRMEGDVRRLTRTLRNMGEIHFKTANKIIGEALRTSTVQRFKESKDPEGRSWEPSTRLYRGKNGKIKQAKHKTLVDKGLLRNSIKSNPSAKGVAIGTNSIYAATHQLGDTRTIKAKNATGLKFLTLSGMRSKKVVRVTIPARPFLGVSDEDMQEIKGILQDTIEELIE